MSKYRVRQYFHAYVDVIVENDDPEKAREIGLQRIEDMDAPDFYAQINVNMQPDGDDYWEVDENGKSLLEREYE